MRLEIQGTVTVDDKSTFQVGDTYRVVCAMLVTRVEAEAIDITQFGQDPAAPCVTSGPRRVTAHVAAVERVDPYDG